MSGFWLGKTVTITVLQRREFKAFRSYWHVVSRHVCKLEAHTMGTLFDEYDMETHRIIITPRKE